MESEKVDVYIGNTETLHHVAADCLSHCGAGLRRDWGAHLIAACRKEGHYDG